MNRREMMRLLAAVLAGVGARPRGLYGMARSRGTTAAPREMAPYTIDVDPELVRDLRDRLERTRWPQLGFDPGWEAGTDLRVLQELVEYWIDEYDWFAVQDRLNRLEHLRGPIEGDALHCVRYAPTGRAAAFPILLLHGWPSSFHEFDAAAPALASGAGGGPSFEVIVPSLPGFAFSDPPSVPGVGADRIAQRMHLLMRELGHERYGVQGGDWGAIIGTQLARRYPESVVGLHVGFVAATPQPPQGTEPTPEETAYRARRDRFQAEETGYQAIQGTRPQTLAYAQTDSPAGWLAWMLEKFWAWGDHRGDLWSAFGREGVLTTAMLYWLPNRILSAARIYYETRRQTGSAGGRVTVPTGYARFPGEPWAPPREVVERSYNLVHYTAFDRGGHFPAMEQPRPWADDVRDFFSTL